MNKILLALLCCLGIGYALHGTYDYAMAQGVDAGIGTDAGPPAAPSPEVTVPPGGQRTMHDPVEAPTGFAEDVLHAYRAAQYAFFVVLVLFGVSRGLLYASDKFDIPFLDKHRTYIVFATSVLGGAIFSLALLNHIDLRVVAGALASAFILELRGRGKMSEGSRAQALYEAYANSTGWKSAVTGNPLPQWEATTQAVRDGWLASAKVV